MYKAEKKDIFGLSALGTKEKNTMFTRYNYSEKF